MADMRNLNIVRASSSAERINVIAALKGSFDRAGKRGRIGIASDLNLNSLPAQAHANIGARKNSSRCSNCTASAGGSVNANRDRIVSKLVVRLVGLVRVDALIEGKGADSKCRCACAAHHPRSKSRVGDNHNVCDLGIGQLEQLSRCPGNIGSDRSDQHAIKIVNVQPVVRQGKHVAFVIGEVERDKPGLADQGGSIGSPSTTSNTTGIEQGDIAQPESPIAICTRIDPHAQHGINLPAGEVRLDLFDSCHQRIVRRAFSKRERSKARVVCAWLSMLRAKAI